MSGSRFQCTYTERARVEVGILAGYEMNHMPNHMNIVFMGKTDASKFRLDCEIMIQ